MTTESFDVKQEAELKKKIEALARGRRVKIWLVQSDGALIDVRFSVGEELEEPPKLFDYAGGFYLLGEGVPPELLGALHRAFEEFCSGHGAVPEHSRHGPIVVHYRSFPPPHPEHRHRVTMHYPVNSFGPFHPPLH